MTWPVMAAAPSLARNVPVAPNSSGSTLRFSVQGGEFVVHYILDFAKIHYSMGVHVDTQPRRFWALHGIDQLTHQLTYAAMIYAVLRVKGLA